jgi:hypothetical protein
MDLKTSLLVKGQLPEFVREEYPLFVSFIEAYYEFLEKEQYDTNGVGLKNNLTEKLKNLRYISDVDFSLEEFETQFFNSFLPFLPVDSQVSKEFLIKNILPLYQAKGTEKSFQFLFRLLFGEEIKITYPRENILRASDGKWSIDNILRLETQVHSRYVSDGLKTEYYLPFEYNKSDIQIFVNDQQVDNFYVRKESKKVIFETTPLNNSVIKIVYPDNFDVSIFTNRKLVGTISGANAIIEKVSRRNLAGLNFYQFFINTKTLLGNFNIGETISIEIIDEKNNKLPFTLQTLSDVDSITITNSGSGYTSGTPILFRGPSNRSAIAIIDEVSSGNVEVIRPRIGNFGAGYKVNNEVYANNYSNTFFSAYIDAVDDSGTISPNKIFYNNTDFINLYSNVVISDIDFGFPANTVNLDSVISDALTTNVVTNLGPAINVFVTTSLITNDSNVEFIANSTLLYDTVRISDLGSIGTIKIIDGGSSYSVGDKIVFTNTEYFSGQGADAVVSSVSLTGAITRITVNDGGYNYKQDYLPILSVDGTGTGANLVVEHFMGQNVKFDYVTGDGIPGKILSINLLDRGSGYTVVPTIDLSLSGDQNATAIVTNRPSLVQLPGRWISSDGLLSSDEIRLQGGNFYIDFSYVITSKVEFQRYKDVVRDLLNPSGTINYGRYEIIDTINSSINYKVFDQFAPQVAGSVNVHSYFVYGTNTFFEVANTIGLMTEGSYIIVNSEIRIVNAIINNTTFTVSQPFNYSANDQLITLEYVPYNAITTEYWREVAITIEGPTTIVLTTEE